MSMLFIASEWVAMYPHPDTRIHWILVHEGEICIYIILCFNIFFRIIFFSKNKVL